MEILWQDQYFAAICKQPGMLSEGTDASLSAPLLAQAALQSPAPLHPVHRLDREVGGVFLLAKDAQTMAAFSHIIGEGKIQKTYMAITEGLPPQPEGELQDLLFHDRHKNKTYTVKRMRQGVRRAALRYRVLSSVNHEGQIYTLIAVTPITGRTHQIRVQFASRRLPLAGDKKYGAGTGGAMGLFCHEIFLTHPITGQALHISASLPDHFPFSLFSAPQK